MNAQPTSTAAPAEPPTTSHLTEVMTRTLPQGGIDRMTEERIEEILAVPALTAHL